MRAIDYSKQMISDNEWSLWGYCICEAYNDRDLIWKPNNALIWSTTWSWTGEGHEHQQLHSFWWWAEAVPRPGSGQAGSFHLSASLGHQLQVWINPVRPFGILPWKLKLPYLFYACMIDWSSLLLCSTERGRPFTHCCYTPTPSVLLSTSTE